MTLLIENWKKSNNWGPLLRCCAAFGISQIFVIGYDKCNVQGSHGASKHVDLLAFHDHASAVKAVKANGFQLMGVLQGVPDAYESSGYPAVKQFNPEKNETSAFVSTTEAAAAAAEPIIPAVTTINETGNKNENENESGHTQNSMITPKSFPATSRPFSKRTCLVVGKRTKGLTWSLAKHCESFVLIIPQVECRCCIPSIHAYPWDYFSFHSSSVWNSLVILLRGWLQLFPNWRIEGSKGIISIAN